MLTYHMVEKGVCMVFALGRVPTWHSAPALPPPPWRRLSGQDPKLKTMGQDMTAPMARDGNGWTSANVQTCNTLDLTT